MIEHHAAAKTNRSERDRSGFGFLADSDQSQLYVVQNWNDLFPDATKFAHAWDEPLPTGADAEWVENFFRFEEYLIIVQRRSYDNLDELDSLLEKAIGR